MIGITSGSASGFHRNEKLLKECIDAKSNQDKENGRSHEHPPHWASSPPKERAISPFLFGLCEIIFHRTWLVLRV
jgi:hypothetical protein